VAYAATGRPPFGAGNTHSILYRIMYGDADIVSVPDSLLPLVEASLAKDPQGRPTARQLLDRLTSASSRPENANDTPTQVILARTWQSGSHASPSPVSRPAAPLPAPSPPAAGALAAEPAATEPQTADSPAPVLPAGAVPSAAVPAPAAPAPAAPAPEKVPVGRRMATIATSALVAMRLRRPVRPAEPKR